MTQLTRIDTSSLNKALVGFDHIFTDMERRYTNQLATNYPPYNIIKVTDNSYEIQVAVTGFDRSEITVQVESNELLIKAEHNTPLDPEIEFLHRGLAMRNFDRTFKLAEHMKVVKGEIKNGILTIRLEREIPEELKPRIIDIVEIK